MDLVKKLEQAARDCDAVVRTQKEGYDQLAADYRELFLEAAKALRPRPCYVPHTVVLSGARCS